MSKEGGVVVKGIIIIAFKVVIGIDIALCNL